MKKIDVFFAYKFGSEGLPRIDREQAIAEAIKAVELDLKSEFPKIKVSWRGFNLESGEFLKSQIEDIIQSSCIFIADISENNPNVMFELGSAYASSRYRIMPIAIMARSEKCLSDVPSDLDGVFIERYDVAYYRQSVSSVIKKTVKRYIAQYNEFESGQITRKSFWRFEGLSEVDIVCSELPENEMPSFAFPKDRDYLRYARFADLDSLFHIRMSLARSFPEIRFRDFTASEHRGGEYSSLIVIGGPAWNQKTRSFQHFLPIEFVDRPDELDDILVVKDAYEVKEAEMKPQDLAEGVIKDVSVVCRVTDTSDRTSFLFEGALTKGVLGASKAFLSNQVGLANCDYISSRVGLDDFVTVFWSTYADREIQCPIFDIDPPSLVFKRGLSEGGEFVLLENN